MRTKNIEDRASVTTIIDATIEALRAVVGIDISRYDRDFIMKTLQKRLAMVGITSCEEYISCLSDTPSESIAFIESLSISYSEFFRNPLTFAALEQLVLPSLLKEKEQSGKSEIRIWSAGCAAGQEAYSIAILLDEMLAERKSSTAFRIFATDISETALESARQGIFEAASLQNVRLKHLRNCFQQQRTSYQVLPRIRERIDFSVHDLLAGNSSCPPASIFGNFDLIFCSNLLFYYGDDARREILGKLKSCLSPSGYLVTGRVERMLLEKMDGFRAVAPPTAVFQTIYHKGDS